jgi:hypothetical protein
VWPVRLLTNLVEGIHRPLKKKGVGAGGRGGRGDDATARTLLLSSHRPVSNSSVPPDEGDWRGRRARTTRPRRSRPGRLYVQDGEMIRVATTENYHV